MPKTYEKHHYGEWSEDRSNLQGLAKLCVNPGEGWTTCKRCGVFIVFKKPGGVKFWAGGKLVSKRPPCVPVKLRSDAST